MINTSQLGLVIIDDFDIPRTSIRPNEAHAVLVVNTNAVLPGTRTPQGLETIASGTVHIAQSIYRIQLFKFTYSNRP